MSASVVGYVPEELRDAFSRPLPDWMALDKKPVLRGYTWVYDTDEAFSEGVFETELGTEYGHLFTAVATLGEISCNRSDAFIQIDLVQGLAADISTGLGWHTDQGLHFGRLVVSDCLGTLYGDRRSPLTAPDFGILKIGDRDYHSPDRDAKETAKTRLQVTLMVKNQDTAMVHSWN